MHHCINLVLLHTVKDFPRMGEIALVEGEIRLIIQTFCVLQRRTIFKLIEGDDIVCLGICEYQMSCDPGCTIRMSALHP